MRARSRRAVSGLSVQMGERTFSTSGVPRRPPRFSVARYVGRHGWISIRADEVKWPMIEDLVVKSYRLIAPKKLSARLRMP